MITKYTFNDPVIESIYMRYPEFIRKKCLILRDLIFNVGSSDSRIGPINETLRWGAPSYIPLKTKSGSMIRIHHYPNKSFDFALYFYVIPLWWTPFVKSILIYFNLVVIVV